MMKRVLSQNRYGTMELAERLYRWSNWTITEKSTDCPQVSDRGVEFRVALAPNEEKVISYRVRYEWK